MTLEDQWNQRMYLWNRRNPVVKNATGIHSKVRWLVPCRGLSLDRKRVLYFKVETIESLTNLFCMLCCYFITTIIQLLSQWNRRPCSWTWKLTKPDQAEPFFKNGLEATVHPCKSNPATAAKTTACAQQTSLGTSKDAW